MKTRNLSVINMKMNVSSTEISGFTAALRAMRNPMNSWARSDSKACSDCDEYYCDCCSVTNESLNFCVMSGVKLGENDLKTNKTLLKGGPEESKHLRMIHVTADFTMPRYWWSEMDTYKFVEKVSCSTMHRLLNTNEEITEEQFLIPEDPMARRMINDAILLLENFRIRFKTLQLNKPEGYAEEMNKLLVDAKRILPEGYLQRRTIDTNYQELANIYRQRKNHRLKEEWGFFCRWVESLPYASVLITGVEKGDDRKQNIKAIRNLTRELIELIVAIKVGDIEGAKKLCEGRFKDHLIDEKEIDRIYEVTKDVINHMYSCDIIFDPEEILKEIDNKLKEN